MEMANLAAVPTERPGVLAAATDHLPVSLKSPWEPPNCLFHPLDSLELMVESSNSRQNFTIFMGPAYKRAIFCLYDAASS